MTAPTAEISETRDILGSGTRLLLAEAFGLWLLLQLTRALHRVDAPDAAQFALAVGLGALVLGVAAWALREVDRAVDLELDIPVPPRPRPLVVLVLWVALSLGTVGTDLGQRA